MDRHDSLFGDLPGHGHTLDEKSVHSIRKGTKQLRAHLHLLRQLDGQKQETERLRQSVKKLARLLAVQRDADVMSSLLEELISESPDAEVKSLLTDLREGLKSERLPVSDMADIRKLTREIEKNTHKLLKDKPSESDINKILEQRLQHLCEIGHDLLYAAENTDWEALHNWRKQVKKLMYQYKMKQSPSQRDITIFNQLEKLGSSLGRFNDQGMLESYVRDREKLCTWTHTLLIYERVYELIQQHRLTALSDCRLYFDSLNQLR